MAGSRKLPILDLDDGPTPAELEEMEVLRGEIADTMVDWIVTHGRESSIQPEMINPTIRKEVMQRLAARKGN